MPIRRPTAILDCLRNRTSNFRLRPVPARSTLLPNDHNRSRKQWDAPKLRQLTSLRLPNIFNCTALWHGLEKGSGFADAQRVWPCIKAEFRVFRSSAIAASCLCCAKLGSGNGNRIIKIIPKFARSRRFPLRPKSTGKRCPLTGSYPLGIRVRLVGQGFASVANSRPRITIIIQGQLIELITERRSKVYVAGGRLCSSFRQKVTTGAHGNRGITGLPFAL